MPRRVARSRTHVTGVLPARHASWRRWERKHRARAWHQDILERVTDAFYAVDESWVFTYVNPEAERVLKQSRCDLVGSVLWDAYPELVGGPVETEYRQAAATGRTTTFEFYFDPFETWFEIRVYPSTDGLSVYFRDIGRERAAAERLALSEALHRTLIEQTPAVIYSTSETLGGPLRYVSPYVEQLLGRPPAAYLADHTVWKDAIAPDDKADVTDAIKQSNVDHLPLSIEYRVHTQSGAEVWVHDVAAPVTDDAGNFRGWQGIVRDITQVKRTESQLRYLAHHDSLTGLGNRAALDEHLLASLRFRSPMTAVLFIDMDRFKLINDAYGHVAGDDLLIQTGQAIQLAVGQAGEVYRFGGDEFVVILRNMPTDQASDLADRIIHSLRLPVMIGTHEVAVGVSIGVTFTDASNRSPGEILRQAGTALHVAKGKGRGQVCIYSSEVDRAPEHLRLVSELNRALANDDFCLFFQPIVDLRNDHLIAVEALLRMRHPEQGIISPGQFIPLAEETGLIVPIGDWVIDESCRSLTEWDRILGGASPPMINVNLAARQLREPNFCERLEALITRHGVSPERFCFEISERTAIEDLEGASETITALHRLGIPLALDDFGAGTSSLALLHALQVRAVKLDARFVQRLDETRWDRMVVEGMTRLAHDLSIVVTAEGVETLEHATAARDAGCDYTQGYFVAQPMDSATMAQWLTARSKRE